MQSNAKAKSLKSFQQMFEYVLMQAYWRPQATSGCIKSYGTNSFKIFKLKLGKALPVKQFDVGDMSKYSFKDQFQNDHQWTE